MMHTDRIEHAIRFAGKHHRDHMRHDALPYLTHLFSVALLTTLHEVNEDMVITGLLHDALEDTDATAEEVEAEFGVQIRAYVESLTEELKENRLDRTWKERKESYLEALVHAPLPAFVVAIADKIHNAESLAHIIEQDGCAGLRRFGAGGKGLVWFHKEVLRLAETRIPASPITERLRSCIHNEERLISLCSVENL